MSLQLITEDGKAESMHHSQGALTESLYIYLPVAKWGQEHIQGDLRMMSIGLGVGLNEFMIFAYFLTQNTQNELYIESFESDPYLIEQLVLWLKESPCELESLYNTNLELISQHFNVPPNEVKLKAHQLLKEKKWRLSPALTEKTVTQTKFHGLLYDFFSSKMNQHLWSFDFLDQFIKKFAQKSCCLASYASTSQIKKALRENNFLRHNIRGFSGKREATWATRL